MKECKPGDVIVCQGETVTIDEIIVWYYDEPDGYWDIEFIDTNGEYRHWKQRFDGGALIQD